MVLSLRTKSRRGPTVQVDYIVHVQDIKPWPPSQSLKNIRSVFIQWENGDRSSGATSIVMPSVDDGKIEFSDYFRLPVILLRDMSVRSTDTNVFLNNLLEFNLYEPRRDKTVRGQLLGTAIMDLAEYGAVKEITSVSVPINCTRNFRNTAQPILYIKIQPVDKGHSSTSSRGSLAKEASSDNNGIDSVSALMNEEYAEEAELASLTDDDVSSHSSLAASSASGSLALQNVENGSGLEKENHASPSKHGLAKVDASAAAQSLENQKGGIKSNPGDDDLDGAVSSESFSSHESSLEDKVANLEDRVNPAQNCKVEVSNSFPVRAISLDASYCMDEKLNFANDTIGQDRERTERKLPIHEKNNSLEVVAACSFLEMEAKVVDNHEPNEVVWQIMEERKHSLGVKDRFTPDAVRNQVLSGNDMPFCKDRVKHVKSVRSSMDSARSNGSPGVTFASVERKEAKVYPAERRNITSDSKIQELEHRIQMLEGELREAAAIEVSLYSIVAEHGSSISKVHAPARRLSRLYFLAGKRSVQLRRSSAARNAVSGLVVVAKACGSDVPRYFRTAIFYLFSKCKRKFCMNSVNLISEVIVCLIICLVSACWKYFVTKFCLTNKFCGRWWG
ncbi:hypothetical protein Nepgr_026245 [Nepenthes gracilis]|uniref:C2 NT-type domain-containing protein n=1 Tax=Nepenthes gracilis TaxID=150966 RepID=A0AAD3Y080_NEPGR|nr:hypothetical protein Nepgr_026245 [Nepenthes gracilis]